MRSALLLCFLLSSCQTVVYGPDGRPQFRTYGDVAGLTFTGPGTTLHADTLNHSTPTRAGGSVVGTAFTGIGGAITSAGMFRH
jgi:hypothetical protein